MKKYVLFMMSILILGMMSCSKKPSQIVDEMYKNAEAKNYANSLPLIIPDSVAPFTDEEKEAFNGYIARFMPGYNSYTIVECPDVDKNATEVPFTVNTSFKDGTAYTEKGLLRKDNNGNWKLVIEALPNDTVMPYSVTDYTKRTPELIRNLKYAYEMVMASRSIPEFQLKAANYYYDGVMTDKNKERYFELVQNAANQGDPQGLYELGEAYFWGKGVKYNDSKAFEYAKKAADLGNGDAMARVGYIYYEGVGIPKNYEEAAKWFQKAIDTNGNGWAMNNLGSMYENGLGVEQNYRKAFELYNGAAEKAQLAGVDNLAWLYQKGLGVDKNPQIALQLAIAAAEEGYTPSMIHVADIYYNGEEGINQDYNQAFYWYNKAAESKDLYAEYMVGQCYEYGRGAEKNLAKAKEWYRNGWIKNYKPSLKAYNNLL